MKWEDLVSLYMLTTAEPAGYEPSYNAAPSQRRLIVPEAGHAELRPWGFKNTRGDFTISARAKTVDKYPRLRNLLKSDAA